MYIEYVHARPRSEKLLNSLAKALDFGAPELLSNRAGALHPNQASRLSGAHVFVPFLGVFLSILAPLLFRFVWAATVEHRSLIKFAVTILYNPPSFLSQMRFGIEEPFPLVIALGYFVFPLVLIHYMMRVPWKIFFDLVNKKVNRESGYVSVRWDEKRLTSKDGREGDLISRYSYFVNGREYRVSRAAYEALVPQLEYVLYFLPHSRTIISAEPADLTEHKIQSSPAGILQAVKAPPLQHDQQRPTHSGTGVPSESPAR